MFQGIAAKNYRGREALLQASGMYRESL
jgi:hypothetical protein